MNGKYDPLGAVAPSHSVFVGVELITLASRLYLRLRCRLVKLALYAKSMHGRPFGLE
jgi:hypothetical protein